MLIYLQGMMEVILEILFYKMFLEIFFVYKRIITQKHKLMTLIFLVIMVYAIAVFSINFFVKELLCYISIFFVGCFLFDERKYYIGIMAEIYLGLLLGVDYLTIFIYTVFFSENTMNSIAGQTLILGLGKLILFVIVIIISKCFERKKISLLMKEDLISFLCFPVFSIGIMVVSVYKIDSIVNTEYEIMFWFIIIGVVGMNILLFYLFQRVASREEQLREKEIAEEKANQQLLLYQSFVENFERQNERLHEYKNQIECLQALGRLGKYAEIDRYLKQIGGELHGELDAINTNHPIVNAVLNTKYHEAYYNNIIMDLKINDLSELWLEEKDIVVILSNLLDNAIEALKIYHHKRIMKVKIVLEEQNCIISVRNPYEGKLKYNGKMLLTTKNCEELNHGFGIRNVIKTVNKYHGFYAIRTEDGEFLFSIMIPKMK